MLFKTRNNVPEVYSTSSRDFQLLSAAFDCVYNTLITNQSKLNYLDNIETVDANMLELLKDYLGFFTNQYYPENLLRSILINFPEAIRYKGSLKGVEVAIEALQNAYTDISYVTIRKQEQDSSRISIETDGVLLNQNYIDELLKYVLPIGIIIDQIIVSRDMKDLPGDEIFSQDSVWGLKTDSSDSSSDGYYPYIIGSIRNMFQQYGNAYNLNYFLSKIGQTPVVRTSQSPKKIIIKKM